MNVHKNKSECNGVTFLTFKNILLIKILVVQNYHYLLSLTRYAKIYVILILFLNWCQ